MVHPHDDVALGIAVFGDRNRLSAGADGDQQAGTSADGDQRRVVRPARANGFAYRRAGLRPDVSRRCSRHRAGAGGIV